MKKLVKGFIIFLGVILLIAITTIKVLDKTPAKDLPHFRVMMDRLDAIPKLRASRSPLQIGYAKVSLTPDSLMEMAGYGKRRPKLMEGIIDSIFVRTIALKNEEAKVAIVSADLLIIHPKMRDELYNLLASTNWKKEEIFFSATHTHSSIGQWAPGFVGGLFAGTYDKDVAKRISFRMMESILESEKNMSTARIGFSESKNPDLVINRLVYDKGILDPHLKSIFFKTDQGLVTFSSFSAHATCFSYRVRSLTGDYPSYFHKALSTDSGIAFSSFAAGAVASMGPKTPALHEREQAAYLGRSLSERLTKPGTFDSSVSIRTLKIPLALGSPQFKLTEDLALKSYLFRKVFGEESESSDISVLKLNNFLLIGTPCDFSGELAVPLYEYAKSKGLVLMITSFNGGYMGYVTKDDWYSIGKYETFTMNWYGPGNGEYFSTIIKKIIDATGQN